ncbi:MAG: hypothetical protein A2X18_08800 [Bacteroidetes bacterium GWF2_40_14]|nr:MAG: hypothetical protein A2X18_08800 [Bacteroidetes bacterium GWF2_40_14]
MYEIMNSCFAIRYRWAIIILTAVIVVASIVPITRIKINPDMESYFPDKMESKRNSDKIEMVFGDQEQIVIILETDDVLKTSTLTRIKDLSDHFKEISGFSNVRSIYDITSIKGENGEITSCSLIAYPPTTDSEIEKLRNDIKSNENIYGSIISKDFRYTVIILNTKDKTSDKEYIGLIKETLNLLPGRENIYINGVPFLRSEASEKIGNDIILLLPIGLIIMMLFLWISFRDTIGVLLPFSVVIFSIVFSMALIPLLGWKLSIIGVLIPIMMIAIANNYGVHFISRYQELCSAKPDSSIAEIVKECLKFLLKPVIFCGLTTIAGVLGLVLHILTPASQMGVVVSIGIAFALLLSITYVPSLLSVLKKKNEYKSFNSKRKGALFSVLRDTSRLVTSKPHRVIFIFLAFLFLSAAGILWVKIAPDSNRILPGDHSYNKSINIADKYLGGSKIINVLVEGDIKDPVLLRKIENMERELEQISFVGSVTSVNTIIKEISKAMNNPEDSLYNRIPDTREAVSQYLELYNMNGNPEELENFTDFDYTKALIRIQFKANTIGEINLILKKIDEAKTNSEMTILTGGYCLVEKNMSETIVSGQYYSLIFAVTAIFILLTVIFGSIVAGVMGTIPLLYAVLVTFGLMGWIGMELNIVTALISSISIGLGVDFTIHLFWRLKKELSAGMEYHEAILTSVTTTGRGIAINALSVMIGFSVLFFSEFPLIRSFAFLIILSLLLCLICALILIPSLCIIIKPEFLKKDKT